MAFTTHHSTTHHLPVRVKVYGLLSLTRRQYLLSLALGLGLLAMLLPVWIVMGREHVEAFLAVRLPAAVSLVAYVPWVVLAAVLLEAIEAMFVLRKFRRLEEQERLLKAALEGREKLAQGVSPGEKQPDRRPAL